MRIWILSSELAHEFAGGIARYLDNFGRLLSAAGHEVVIIASANRAIDEHPAPGFRIIGIESRESLLNEPNPTGEDDDHPAYPYNIVSQPIAWSYQMAQEVLARLHEMPPPDIIESQEVMAISYYLIQRKLTERSILERIPILVHLHTPYYQVLRINQDLRYKFPYYWLGQMEKFCIRAADALLSPSRFCAREIAKDLCLNREITTIPYPVIDSGRLPRAASAQWGNIVYVGRLEVRKGVLPLLEACSRLWRAGHEFQLTLVGGDCAYIPLNTTVGTFMEERYQPWIRSGHIRWLGQLDHAGVLEQLQQAWAVVIPSLWENFPNTCIEAMASGQVVLGSSNGGQAEMIEADGVNGFLFDWQKEGDFEDKLLRILKLNPDERLRLGENARKRIGSLCDPQTILQRRVDHYLEVIDKHAPRQRFPVSARRTSAPAPDWSSAPRETANEERGLLSVIVPYYNMGAYLEETLASIFASTYRPMEVVVVNDGSDDPASVKLLDRLEARGLPGFRVLHTDNQGLPAARNNGARSARGEWIAFVDSDDLVEADFFRRCVDVLNRYENVAFVYSWVRCFEDFRGIWPTWNAEFPYLLARNMLAPLAVVRRCAFLKSGNKKEMEYNFEDYEGWVSLLKAGGVGVSLPDPLVRYRVRTGSMSSTRSVDQQLYLVDLMTQFHREQYDEWAEELFNLQCANGPAHRWIHPGTHFTLPSMQAGDDPGVCDAPSTELPWDYQLAVKCFAALRESRLLRPLTGNPARKERLKGALRKMGKMLS